MKKWKTENEEEKLATNEHEWHELRKSPIRAIRAHSWLKILSSARSVFSDAFIECVFMTKMRFSGQIVYQNDNGDTFSPAFRPVSPLRRFTCKMANRRFRRSLSVFHILEPLRDQKKHSRKDAKSQRKKGVLLA